MLRLNNISKTFQPGTVNEKHALKDIDLHLAPGEFVTVLGSNGAGKSTLAQQLGKKLNIPVVHLDKLFWHPGWVESSKEEIDRKIMEAMAAPQRIMDGN